MSETEQAVDAAAEDGGHGRGDAIGVGGDVEADPAAT